MAGRGRHVCLHVLARGPPSRPDPAACAPTRVSAPGISRHLALGKALEAAWLHQTSALEMPTMERRVQAKLWPGRKIMMKRRDAAMIAAMMRNSVLPTSPGWWGWAMVFGRLLGTVGQLEDFMPRVSFAMVANCMKEV